MESVSFCVKCGQKLTQGSSFCPKCGAKVYIENQKPNIKNVQNEAVYSEYEGKVEDAVTEAYLANEKLDRNSLYRQGEKYGFSKEKIDNIISIHKEKIDKYVGYLRKIYLTEPSLMLEVSEKITEDCTEYAKFLCLRYKEGEDIFNKFIEENRIQDKWWKLMSAVLYYNNTGAWPELEIDAGDTIMESLKEQEYVRLKNVVEQLLIFQKEIHEKSGMIYLSEEDEKKVIEKAVMLGFDRKTGPIDSIIHGNEVKLGYDIIYELEKRKEARNVNGNRLSRIAPPQTITFMGQDCVFGSCYFAERKIREYFRRELSQAKKKSLEMIKKYNVCVSGCGEKFVYDIITTFAPWSNILEKYNGKAGISNEVCEDTKACYEDVIGLFEDDLIKIRDIFTDIEHDIEVTRLNGEMKKALRGRWHIIGSGVDGLIKGAVSQSVLNAGTGLAYDAINGVSMAVARHNVEEAKEKFRDSIIPVIGNFWDTLIKTTADTYIAILCAKYPFILWKENEEYQIKLSAGYTMVDDRYKSSMAIGLLFENPYIVDNYIRAFNELDKEKQPEQDAAALIEIAQMFNMKAEVVKEIILSRFGDVTEVDKETCDNLFRIEQLLQSKYTPIQKNIYKMYLEKQLEQILVSYTSDEVNSAFKLIDEFGKKYEYSADFMKDNIQRAVITQYKIDYLPKTIDSLKFKIEKLKKIDEDYPWDFKEMIEDLEDKLRNMIKEEDTQLRSVKIINKYDMQHKKVQMTTILAPSVEIKEKMNIATKQMEKLCLQISLDVSKDNFESIIQKILSLCNGCQYDTSFVTEIQKKWYEYNEDKEIAGIIRDYRKNMIQKYFIMFYKNYKSDKAKDIVKEQEKKLISYINYIERQYTATKVSEIKKMSAWGDFFLTLLITAIIITINILINNKILKIVCAIIVIFLWIRCIRKMSDVKHEKDAFLSDFERRKKELEQFYSAFRIVDDHIVPIKN